MAALGSVCLCLLLVAASSQAVYDIASSEAAVVNSAGTAWFSVGGFTSVDKGITCYTDYGTSSGRCNVLELANQSISAGPGLEFNGNETRHLAVASFTSSNAVVCFLDVGGTGLVTCRALEVQGDGVTLGSSAPLVVNDNATNVPFISVARLSEAQGLVCYSYVEFTNGKNPLVCALLSLSGSLLSQEGSDFFIDRTKSHSDISVRSFSASKAVVCYSEEGDGKCTLLSIESNAISHVINTEVFLETDKEYFNSMSLVSLTSTSGVLCYADGASTNVTNRAGCSALDISSGNLSVGDREVVNNGSSSYVSAAALADGFGIVCYSDEGDGGAGVCRALAAEGSVVSTGPASVVNVGATEHLSLAGLSADAVALCYSDDGAGNGACTALSLATTTTTATSSTSTSGTSSTTETATGTSSTSASGTSSTSSSTETSATDTTGTTTPHTTTETSFTGTSATGGPTTLAPESAGGFRLSTGPVALSLLSAAAAELLGVLH